MTTTTMPAVATTEKAGFGTRFLAILIDSIGLSIVQTILGNILFANGGFTATFGLNALVSAAYFTYYWSKAGGGQTFGSRALHIKVVKTDGSLLDYNGAFIRLIGYLVSAYCFGIGLIWAAFDANKQGWHDKIAGTYVVRS